MTEPLTIQRLVAMDASRANIEQWAAQHARAVPAGPSYLLCRVLGKHLMYVLQTDSGLTPHLAMSGIWEPWVTMAIARHVQPGMRCLDVGACYGYYSLLMADIVGEQGYVEAWEPTHVDILRQNVLLNGNRIKVAAAAMGYANAGADVFAVPARFPGDSLWNAGSVRTGPLVPAGAADVGRTARVSMPEAQPLDFIKIDVEGAEDDVWQALVHVKNVSPRLTVCMEFTPAEHGNPRAFLQGIVDEGFSLASVDYDGVPRERPLGELIVPDTGDFRTLWLSRGE